MTEKKEKREWKSRFLSSSIPLEFEAAKTLVNKGFTVDFDYSYTRVSEEGLTKEFSIDIDASGLCPFTNPDKISAELSLLIECKYRLEEKVWLFIPEINKHVSRFTLGYGLRLVDDFSPYSINGKYIYQFESNISNCLKGIEVNLSTGEVYDNDIKAGISQLKYSLPTKLKDRIYSNLAAHPDDNIPFFLCPILLTTSDLRILDKHVTMESIKKTEQIGEITKSVPFLLLLSKAGPEFKAYHEYKFERFASSLFDIDNARHIYKLKNIHNVQTSFKERSYLYHPEETAIGLEHSDYFTLQRFYSHYFVCQWKYFGALVDAIKHTFVKSVSKRKKIETKQDVSINQAQQL